MDLISETYLMDCMQGMKEYPDNYFDLAVVDPPYGIGRDGSVRTTSKHGGRKAHKFKGWDNEIPTIEYFTELFRVSKNQIISGQKVIDTHLGSGSNRIAAHKNGLHFVGFEIDEEYFNAANKRFDNFKSQTRLF